jgi:Fur family ferric uptake transcriptional regulator
MICKECGVVIEFCDPRILEIQSLMEKIHDFNVDGHSLHLFGTCQDKEACNRRKQSGDKIKTMKD